MADQIVIDFTCRFPSGVDVEASIDRAVPPGSILVVFGPSSAGKTTVLRAIAGLLRPDRGRIAFGPAMWFDSSVNRCVPPQRRRVGYISQDTLLFPHLTVKANIEYGGRERTAELIDLIQLRGLEDRYPRQLSGGQAQRVALARALAPGPPLVLLDEPFGALDAATRRMLRADVRRLLRDLGTAAILVTHDRLEAMAMGDDLAVMVDGRVRQVGPMADVFRRPADSAVARSLGVETILPALVDANDEGLVRLRLHSAVLTALAEGPCVVGDQVFACIRAEDITVELVERKARSSGDAAAAGSARNHLAGTVVAIEPEGAVERVTIDCGFELVAAITRQSREALALAPGMPVAAAIKATAIHVVHKT
jgi:molybdate transport system ATP-binding protein